MNCTKAQSLITPFINDKLSLKELESFIDHVQVCKSCREELEVYYTLLTAMKQLEQDQELSNNYRVELSEKIEQMQERIIHIKFTRFRKTGVLLLVIVLLAFLMNFQNVTRKNAADIIRAESKFRLRYVFDDKRYGWYDIQLENYFENMQK